MSDDLTEATFEENVLSDFEGFFEHYDHDEADAVDSSEALDLLRDMKKVIEAKDRDLMALAGKAAGYVARIDEQQREIERLRAIEERVKSALPSLRARFSDFTELIEYFLNG